MNRRNFIFVLALAVVYATASAVYAASVPVMYVFSADWCHQCQLDKPVVERMQNVVRVVTIDADTQPDVLKRNNVTSLPTYILVADGVVKWRGQSVEAAYNEAKGVR